MVISFATPTYRLVRIKLELPGAQLSVELAGPARRCLEAAGKLGAAVAARHVDLPLHQAGRGGEIEALYPGQEEEGVGEVERSCVLRLGEVRARQIGEREFCAGDVCAGKVGASKIRLREVDVDQDGVSKIRALH